MELNPYKSPQVVSPPRPRHGRLEWFRQSFHPLTLVAVVTVILVGLIGFGMIGLISGH
jgi:hypothetical protein